MPRVPDTCAPTELKADKAHSVPLSNFEDADFSFPGDLVEQVEFVWIETDGRYHYAERFDFGFSGDTQMNIGWDWKRDRA